MLLRAGGARVRRVILEFPMESLRATTFTLLVGYRAKGSFKTNT